jgi:hypothetical protein
MTTYKCNKCGAWWSQGPTRDVKENVPCAECLTEILKTVTKALQEASNHLDYCGYGDNWERECAREDKLEEHITTALEQAHKILEE